MALTDKDFKIMLLRPAVFNGREIELNIQFNNASLYRTEYIIAQTLDMTPGDTASIGGRVCYDDEDELSFDYIKIYISENTLGEFIEKYGTSGINTLIRMRLEFIYELYSENEPCYDEKKDELIACKLLQLLPDSKNS